MLVQISKCDLKNNRDSAFTLVEVSLASAIAGVLFVGTIYGYLMASQKAEWAAYYMAAHTLGMQRIEQARSCQYDPLGYPPSDELVSSNFPAYIDLLDVPFSGTNNVYGTSTVSITTISTIPPLKMITVATTWPFPKKGTFTNLVSTYRGQDQ
jgi:prepilin-type N-terminal cleavage/methylation domain-containing protein